MGDSFKFNGIIKKGFQNFDVFQKVPTSQVIISLLISLCVAMFIFAIYKYTFKGVVYKYSYNISLVLLVVILAFILIQINISRTGVKNYTESEIKPVSATYIPIGSDNILSNPYMGLVMNATANKTFQPFSLLYLEASWKELEQKKGEFDFAAFEKDKKVDYWKAKGVKFVFRLYLDKPSKNPHMDIPTWAYDEMKLNGTYYDEGNNKGFAPDYTNIELIKYHEKLIKEIGQRYNNDNSFAFVEIGSVGHWGEWHNTLLKDKTTFPLEIVSNIYVNHYLKYLNGKKLLMRRPFQIAKDNELGLYNDSFGDDLQTNGYFLNWIDNGYKDSNTKEIHPSMSDYWKTSPSGGEVANYPGEQYLEPENIEKTLEMIKSTHTTFLGPSHQGYNLLTKEKQANLDKILKLIGYRFSVIKSQYTDLNYSGNYFNGSVGLKNSGVAPFYFDWGINVNLQDVLGNVKQSEKIDYDIKKILPGEVDIPYKFKLKKELPAGVYNLNLAIIDPESGKPSIQFANKGSENKKTCYLGDTTVNMPYPYICNSLKNNEFYNYISYENDSIKIESIPQGSESSKKNNCYIYKNTNAKGDCTINLELSKFDDFFEAISLIVGENENSEKLLKLEYKNDGYVSIKSDFMDSESAVKLPLKLSVEKRGNNIKVINLEDKKALFKSELKGQTDITSCGIKIDFKNSATKYVTGIDKFTVK